MDSGVRMRPRLTGSTAGASAGALLQLRPQAPAARGQQPRRTSTAARCIARHRESWHKGEYTRRARPTAAACVLTRLAQGSSGERCHPRCGHGRHAPAVGPLRREPAAQSTRRSHSMRRASESGEAPGCFSTAHTHLCGSTRPARCLMGHVVRLLLHRRQSRARWTASPMVHRAN